VLPSRAWLCAGGGTGTVGEITRTTTFTTRKSSSTQPAPFDGGVSAKGCSKGRTCVQQLTEVHRGSCPCAQHFTGRVHRALSTWSKSVHHQEWCRGKVVHDNGSSADLACCVPPLLSCRRGGGTPGGTRSLSQSVSRGEGTPPVSWKRWRACSGPRVRLPMWLSSH
jgi:hypothetical protein